MTKNNQKISKTEGFFTFQLTESESEDLCNILEFAANAATILANAEAQQGTSAGVKRMAAISSTSKKILHKIIKFIEIGEPENDTIN